MIQVGFVIKSQALRPKINTISTFLSPRSSNAGPYRKHSILLGNEAVAQSSSAHTAGPRLAKTHDQSFVPMEGESIS